MKRHYMLPMVAFCVLMLCTSCLKGNDGDDTLYNDTAVSAFSLGTLNRYLHTTSSTGQDSIYMTTIVGSNYRFTIDQVGHRIYNPDSLPVGTDVEHVICNLTTYNNGIAFFESLTSPDSMRYYSSTDSVDFSVPRKLRVYAYSSPNYVTYTVNVNVHKQDGDEFNWMAMTALSGEAQQAFDDRDKGKSEALAAGMKQFIGHSTTELYALSDDNLLMFSTDGGQTWNEDLLDDDASLLPTDDIASVCYDYPHTTSTDYVLMVGLRDGKCRMWHKIIDYSATITQGQWVFMEEVDNNTTQRLPGMKGLSLVKYGDKVLAFGLDGSSLAVYESKDNGLTWNASSTYALPSGLDNSAPIDVVVDSENCLWIVQSATNQVWRGRLNRLGWEIEN